MDWLGARGFLIDLDGTLVSAGALLKHARWLLERTEGRYVIVSNDAEHTPEQLSRRLNRLGLHVDASRLLLAGATALEMLARERPQAGIMLLGSRQLAGYARLLGLTITDDRPEIVAVMRDRHFSYARLSAAANALHRGAEMLLACPDTSHPGRDASLVPEAGALAAAILACAGRAAPDIVIGKPQPRLFVSACERLGIAPADAVMIGDNPATDGAGATSLGMPFIHVGNGDIGLQDRNSFTNDAIDSPVIRSAAGG